MTNIAEPTPEMIADAAALYVADECDSIEEARLNIERVRKFMSEGVTARHDGDCTKQCHTCLRCLTEGYLRQVAIFHAMRSAPQEPVADDDARWLRGFADDCEADIEPSRKECGRLRRIADRLDAVLKTMIEINGAQQEMVGMVTGLNDRLQAETGEQP